MTANAEHSQKTLTDLKRAVRASEELLQDSAGAAGEKAHELRQRLSEALESAKTTCSRLQERTRETAKATDKAVRDHPYQSIGVAAGLGLLLGWLIARRR